MRGTLAHQPKCCRKLSLQVDGLEAEFSGRSIKPISTDNASRIRDLAAHPLPMKGIFVAITVMNCTLASSGRLAM